MVTDSVIETEGLTKQYGSITAVDNLSLHVPRHAIFGFLGPNGAGKTTLMRLLLGLIRPSAGRGSVFGHDIVDDNLAIRARVGYLPQQPSFYQEMTSSPDAALYGRFLLHRPPNHGRGTH
jgi:ABC-2 type transport system ATP-binding protein